MLANLVESNPNPVLSLDANGVVLYANPAARVLFNETPPPDWTIKVLQTLHAPLGPEREVGAGALPPAHTAVPLSFISEIGACTYQFTLLPDTVTGGILAFGQDISRQRQLEAAQRLNEERFELVSRAAPGILYDWNFETNEVYRSQGLAEMIGLETKDVIASPDWWNSRLHPDDYIVMQNALGRLRDGSSDSISFEYRVRHADGHWVHVWDRGYLLRNDDGHPRRLVGQTSDITEQKRREKKVSFLAQLAEELAEMTSPKAAARLTARRVGEYLEVDRCVVTNIDADRICVEADDPPDLPELDESYPLDIISAELLAILRDHGQIVVEDAASDPRTQADYAAGRMPEWVGAFVSTPGAREGLWLGSLTIISNQRRTWRGDELDLLHQASDLMWLSVEKTRLLTENKWGEQLFVRVVNEIPVGIAFLSGPEHRYAMVNAGYRRIAAEHGELIGRTVAEVWPEMAEEWTAILDDIYNTGEPFYRENLPARIQRNGRIEEVYFHTSCSLLTDPEGGVSGLLVTVREITSEVRAQQAISEERARLKALIEHAPVGIVLSDEAARVTLANPSSERLLQRPLRVGAPYSSYAELQLSHPDGSPYEPRDLPLTRAALDGETKRNIDMMVTWPTGEVRPMLVNAAPVRSENGRLLGAVSIFQDISERIELRDGLAYQARVLETVHDAILATDMNLKITSWNQAAEALYGWSAEEMIGSNAWDQLIIEGDDAIRERIFQRLWQGEAVHGDRVHFTRDGRRLFVDISLAAMKDSSGRSHGYVAAIRDVTDRREAEDSLRNYAARLERSNHDLEDFAFIASHDMQEPLRKVRSFGELLKVNYREQLDERGADYVDRMVNAAVRMQRMLDSLLAYSRVSTRGLPFEPVDLNAAAAAALEDLDDRLRSTGGVVEVGSLPTIEADPQQMEQVFQNLIGNGLKFHAPGERPYVRVEGRVLPGNVAEITFTDNGVGFSMEFIDRLFQPFQRLHGRSAFEGSGVGLAICRKIAERHSGSVTGSSTPGRGATFVLKIPVKQ